MIVKLHKYLLFGSSNELDQFFFLAQKAGFLEFIGTSFKKRIDLPEEAKEILAAIKIAKEHALHPDQLPNGPLDPLIFARKLIGFQAKREELLEKMRLLKLEISRVAPFGSFSKEDLDALQVEGKRVIQFFCMKSELARTTRLEEELIFIATEYDLDYFLAIHTEPKRYPKMIEIVIDKPFNILKEELAQANGDFSKNEEEIRSYSNALPKLQEGLTHILNEHALQSAKNSASLPMEEKLFAIEAWVPENRLQSLKALLSSLHVHAERISIEPQDKVPTCIENRGTAKIGEDLVQVYDTPSPNDKDPSLWVLIFFSLFFAMIISDAGYGALFLLGACLCKWKFPKAKGPLKRMIKLMFILSTSCILWGVATSSYFGIEIGPNNPLRKSSILYALAEKKAAYHLQEKDDVYEEYLKDFPQIGSASTGREMLIDGSVEKEGTVHYVILDDFSDNLMMEFAFLAGILHISLSFLRYLFRNWGGIGWIGFIVGGYLYFPSIVNATTLVNILGLNKHLAHPWGLWLIFAGLGTAFVIAWIQKKWGAFLEVINNAIQVFGDILSYLRLYALSLGGMVMAKTFNDHLGIEAGLIASIVIIVIGHANNIVLCIMGGVIHGLRLNFLEWYHYSFEGDGRTFHPLRIEK